jgi:protein-L-isoaspartate(D-aspartate) O-methyltransferase
MDFERARFNMIEQQIRPWNVLDQQVLDLLGVVRREEFVPSAMRAMAFADLELPLSVDGRATGEVMLPPRVEARLLQELQVRSTDTVLEIGAGSGYMAALLGRRAQQVDSLEIDAGLAAFARSNLARAGIRNVRVIEADGSVDHAALTPVDLIVLSGAVPEVPQSLLDRLNPGGRLAAIVGVQPVMKACILRRSAQGHLSTEILFETLTRPLRGFSSHASFSF